jgi:RTX calcium-binding nonapeptide repeat (4 copies)
LCINIKLLKEKEIKEFTTPLPGYVWGTEDSDSLNGGRGADDIYGLGGDDWLYGDTHNDTVHGGSGNDLVDGGIGNDQLYGGVGADRMFGRSGHDTLYGGADDDKIYGEGGADRLFGGSGDDFLYGEGGKDRMTGGDGADKFRQIVDYFHSDEVDLITDFSHAEGDKIKLTVDFKARFIGENEFHHKDGVSEIRIEERLHGWKVEIEQAPEIKGHELSFIVQTDDVLTRVDFQFIY